jgi:hypothetical protein
MEISEAVILQTVEFSVPTAALFPLAQCSRNRKLQQNQGCGYCSYLDYQLPQNMKNVMSDDVMIVIYRRYRILIILFFLFFKEVGRKVGTRYRNQ